MANTTYLIGLTGSIGSGKSTVARYFELWGSKIIDFDHITRSLLSSDQLVIKSIIEIFGRQVLRPDKSIDRFALRALVFSDSKLKLALEGILHPIIRSQAKNQADKLISAGTKSVCLLIPLLFESSKPYPDLTCKVLVACSRETCLQRASKRDSIDKSTIARIYDSQLPLQDKIKLADYIIENEGDLKTLEKNARKVFDLIHNS